MALSRRAFVRTLGVGGAVWLARPWPARVFASDRWERAAIDAWQATGARPILLHNNENPLGPGPGAIEAIKAALRGGAEAGRYPFDAVTPLVRAIADVQGVAPDHIAVGCGSTELLRNAVQAYTSPTRPLVTAAPSYEECPQYAELIGTPVKAIPLDGNMKLDLRAMAEAAAGAGLVFVNNPNNPTATVHSGDAIEEFVARVRRTSPDTTILIDEAYHDYVTDPAYRTMIPLAVKTPRVLVARTFSKAHGMAGLRVGYLIGQPETVRPVAGWNAGSVNLVGLAAAAQSITDQARLQAEAARNTAVRRYTLEWFAARGFPATDSQCNFIFVNVKRPAKVFRDACREHGVIVGRDFPPFEQTHVRISIGTMEEMQRATAVFAKVLGVAAAAAAA
jgi:histidinol-phosphate aminotransferase